ncbi:unnamed protein product [Rotaria sordida]|uniref:Ion transport domain-containing protein n=1 Tax=Rotaria sordida TaxID=392033 RepID=A0A818WI69_9BILA|nr:unnamed protein product [Rotaria sordida]
MSDHRWKNQQYNFDNLGRALLTLFVLALKDGWIPRMYNDIDAVSVEMQPIKNYNEATLIYFISFILIVRFFLLNMFAEEARNKVKHAKKIERQQRLIRELPYYTRFPLWRKCLHDVYISKYFDLIITAIIILNVVTMSLEYYSMPSDLDKVLEYLFKLLKIATGVRALLDTVVHSLPQIGNLGLLFFLFFFIFTTLGVELFGKLECSEEQLCSGLNKHAHFKNFGMTLLTLFRIATGDN